uniref:CRAL-TRIO domain-containing protein n=1 Tax=Gadus morhua TaxID=8049 RepID=A0A8C5FG15_GADMO
MDANNIMPILKKKLAFLSGGKDRRSGLILTIPLCSDQTNLEELSTTLHYLLSIPSERCKARGFTVIVDGRKSQWNIVKTVVLMLQNVIPAEVSLVCVVKPDEFWDKKVTHFCFWKEKDRLGFEVILVSANKLTRYIEPCQLTDEFGGSLEYDHIDWLNKRLVRSSCSALYSSLLSSPALSPTSLLLLFCSPLLFICHELLSELQQRRFNGSEGGGGENSPWCPMEEELLAQPQVLRLLDSLREQYTRYQEARRLRSKRSQLEEVHAKVTQVVQWLEGPGCDQLKTSGAIGDSLRESQDLQHQHELIESQHSEWFAVYVELNQQIAALLSGGEEEEQEELRLLQQQLSDVCYRQANQLEHRQTLLQSAQSFHGSAHELSQQLDGLLGMLCADVVPADGASIQQSLKQLEESLKAVECSLQVLREKGQALLEQVSSQPPLEVEDPPPVQTNDNVHHIHSVLEDMQLRKQRCEDMVDVRRLKMLQMVQLFKCEEDSSQAVEWLGELLEALLKTHLRLGDDAQDTSALIDKHTKFIDVAQSTYDYGRQLLQATVVLCQSLRCATRSSGETLPQLQRVWKQFSMTADERLGRLTMALRFHTAADKVFQEREEELEDVFEELETVGRSLLDRLSIPVVFPDGTEQFFGTPGETASSAEAIRERLLLVEEQRGLRLAEEGGLNREGQELDICGRVQLEAGLDVIGEEANEEEEEEKAGREEEENRATQDG